MTPQQHGVALFGYISNGSNVALRHTHGRCLVAARPLQRLAHGYKRRSRRSAHDLQSLRLHPQCHTSKMKTLNP